MIRRLLDTLLTLRGVRLLRILLWIPGLFFLVVYAYDWREPDSIPDSITHWHTIYSIIQIVLLIVVCLFLL